ncbi:MAG: acetyltransferase [Actinomycetota bacterium]|nr:acetyltransferase [Actinomycetota bacterium]
MDDLVVAGGDLSIRRLRPVDEDLQLLVRWRSAPHVRPWWDPDLPPLDLEGARDEYLPDLGPDSTTTLCIIEQGGAPIGFVQFYRWADEAAAAEEVGIPFDEATWGIDVMIGEERLVDRGLGSAAVALLCDHLAAVRGATAVVLTTDVENGRAIRSYEKAGFERRGRVLDTDTKDGERVPSWLMVRETRGG